MEAQPGPRKKKHGRTVYSQTANAIRQRKLKGLGEFAEGAAAETPLQPISLETPPESNLPPGELSTEAIGVVTTVTVPEPVAAPEEEPQGYFCMNCKGKVTLGEFQCPWCEEELNWSGLR
jgi:hypothetical protein